MWSEDAAECGVTLDLSVAGESASRRRRMPITEVLNAPLPPPSLLYAPSSFFSHAFSRSDGWMDGYPSFISLLILSSCHMRLRPSYDIRDIFPYSFMS